MKAKITIEGINTKNGTSKNGKNWTRFSFYDGQDWYGMWPADWNIDLQNAQEGDPVEFYYIKKDFKGKTQYEIVSENDTSVKEEIAKEKELENFKMALKKLDSRIEILDERISEIEQRRDK